MASRRAEQDGGGGTAMKRQGAQQGRADDEHSVGSTGTRLATSSAEDEEDDQEKASRDGGQRDDGGCGGQDKPTGRHAQPEADATRTTGGCHGGAGGERAARKRRPPRPGPEGTARQPSKRRRLLARGGVSRDDEVPALPSSLVSDRRGEEANAGEQTTNGSRDDGGERPQKPGE